MSKSGGPVALWVDPPSYHLERDLLWNVESTATGEGLLGPYVHLRERLAELGVPVHTGDLLVNGDLPPAALNIFVTMGAWTRYRRVARREDTILSAFFVKECPVVEPRLFRELDRASTFFRRMYSFAGDEAMRSFIRSPVHFKPYRYPYPFTSVNDNVWSRGGRRFLTVINSNKIPRLQTNELYTERLRAIAFFEARGEIDLYGMGWDGPPLRVGQTRVPAPARRLAYLAERRWDRLHPERHPLTSTARRAWRGRVASKSATLSGYTFAICFENMAMQGWVTEKIFDCLVAGTIPVYLGAPDVTDWVDAACFVDMRRFSGYDELREYLRDLSPAEIDAYREAGREYFRSDQFRPFSKYAFAERFTEILTEDAGIAA